MIRNTLKNVYIVTITPMSSQIRNSRSYGMENYEKILQKKWNKNYPKNYLCITTQCYQLPLCPKEIYTHTK